MADLQYLEFEKPVLDVVSRLKELQTLLREGRPETWPEKDLQAEINRLDIQEKRVLRLLYRNLTPWQTVQVARHPNRPHARAFIENLIDDFVPLAGDRQFAEDPAMVAGLGRFNNMPVAVLGTEKGGSTTERVRHGFGMPKPEGYRKAQRIMKMADKFALPLITFIDTPGAYPGVEAEARGQGEAIAACIETSLSLDVPVVAVITGEGGSGGALALATADKVLMLQYAVYSVISPEGCASILWRDAAEAEQAAEALKMTAPDLLKLKIIDGIIKEPVGGAQRNPDLTFERVKKELIETFDNLNGTHGTPRHVLRRERFLNLTRPGTN